MRGVVRDILTKCQKEIKQIEYETHSYIRDNIWIKVGDILEVELYISYEPLIDEDESSYRQRMICKHNGNEIWDFDETLSKDQLCCSIEEYFACYLEATGITDYEVFDVEDNGNYQTAKIKVKAIK